MSLLFSLFCLESIPHIQSFLSGTAAHSATRGCAVTFAWDLLILSSDSGLVRFFVHCTGPDATLLARAVGRRGMGGLCQFGGKFIERYRRDGGAHAAARSHAWPRHHDY